MKTGRRELGTEGSEGALVGMVGASVSVGLMMDGLVSDGSLMGVMMSLHGVRCSVLLSHSRCHEGGSGEEEEVECLGMHVGG